jgi:rod shape-determining protein MreC
VVAISSQPNNINNQLFVKGKPSAASFAFCLILSLILMTADYRFRSVNVVRSGFSMIVAPLQYVIDYPSKIIGNGQALLRSQKALAHENMQLRYEQIMMDAQLQKLLAVKNENSQLKALLQAASKMSNSAMAAQILAVDTTSSRT